MGEGGWNYTRLWNWISGLRLLSQDLYDCETSVTVHVKGGNLLMERVGEEIYMTGPATLICKGQYLYN